MKQLGGKVLAVVAVLVLIGVGGAFSYIKKNATIKFGKEASFEKSDLLKSPEEAKKEIADLVPTPQPNFTKTGHLQGDSEEGWKLLYGEPGNPAVIANLDFNFRSKCDFGSGEGICNEQKFEVGIFVQIEGEKSGDDVTVIRMKVME